MPKRTYTGISRWREAAEDVRRDLAGCILRAWRRRGAFRDARDHHMGLQKRGAHWYGESQADIRTELERYAELAGYPAERFADARCLCAGRLFALELDEAAGVAVRSCTSCGIRHVMADGAEYVAEAALEGCACPCGAETFELTLG